MRNANFESKNSPPHPQWKPLRVLGILFCLIVFTAGLAGAAGADGIVIDSSTVDVTTEGIESFKAIKEFWYEQLKLHALKDIVIGIAGNKADMFDKEEVSEQDARDFANQIGAQFRLTSAFENTGIDELFLSVVNKLLDPTFQDTLSNLGKKNDGKKIVLNQDPKTGKIKKKDGCC